MKTYLCKISPAKIHRRKQGTQKPPVQRLLGAAGQEAPRVLPGLWVVVAQDPACEALVTEEPGR